MRVVDIFRQMDDDEDGVITPKVITALGVRVRASVRVRVRVRMMDDDEDGVITPKARL